MSKMAVTQFLIITLALFFVGCATTKKPRNPSEYLLTSDRDVSTVFTEIQTKLEKYKYKAQKADPSAGILMFEPRRFSYDGKKGKASAQQHIYMRQEGGSVKLRFNYECLYGGEKFVPCLASDKEVSVKISKIEPNLVNMIKPLLMKHN